MEDFAIKVENVSKVFRLPLEKNSSVKSLVVNSYKRQKGYELQRALEDVSFEIKKGEFFGIVGRNGSGKSTLLKLLAGIYSPTKGQIHINGSLTPFIELGVGFNNELTGRENVFLNGALLGFNRKEMQKMYKDIVDFAELERFMDQKLKNYSSGMQVRLAFSIAIRAQSDILLLDEVLAVGDAAFQRKCLRYFGELKKDKRTVVFVSHDMESVRQYCNQVVFLDQGQVKAMGEPKQIIPEYLKVYMDESEESQSMLKDGGELPLGMSSLVNVDRNAVRIHKAWAENDAGKNTHEITDSDKFLTVKFEFSANKDVGEAVPGVIISNYQGDFITASNSRWANYKPGFEILKKRSYLVTFKLPNIYEDGDYKVSINLVDGDMGAFYDWKNEFTTIHVSREFTTGAKANPKYKVSIEAAG